MTYRVLTWELGRDERQVSEHDDLEEAKRAAESTFISDVMLGRIYFAVVVHGTGEQANRRYWQRTQYQTLTDGFSAQNGSAVYNLPSSPPAKRGSYRQKGAA